MAGLLDRVRGWFGRRSAEPEVRQEPAPEPQKIEPAPAPVAKAEPKPAKVRAPVDPNAPKKTKKPNKAKKGPKPPAPAPVVQARPAAVPAPEPVLPPPVVEKPIVEEAPPPIAPRPAPPRKKASQPSRKDRDRETVAWVVVPKFEALLASVDEALAREPADRAALASARSRFQRGWQALLPLPASEAARLGSAYDAKLTALAERIAALPDPRLEEEAKALEARRALIAEAVALGGMADGRAAVERAKALQKAWKDAPRVSKEALATEGPRFKAAIDAVFARRDGERSERIDKLRALADQADVLARSSDPERAAEAMKQLQTRWKAVGGVRGEEGDALWARFRAAADQVFEKRRTATVEKETANTQAREALIAQARSLAADGVADPDEAIRQLTAKWKRIGRVQKERADALWAEFKAACDALRTPPPVDPDALGEGGELKFNPFAGLSKE